MSNHSGSTTERYQQLPWGVPAAPTVTGCCRGRGSTGGLETSGRKDGKHRDLTLKAPSFRFCPGVEEMWLLSKEGEGVRVTLCSERIFLTSSSSIPHPNSQHQSFLLKKLILFPN